MGKRLVVDIETNTKHDTIWLAVTRDIDSGEVICHRTPESLINLASSVDHWTGHNVIAFDAYLLNKLWGTKIRLSQLRDTLILSRLLNPEIDGGHSLDAWGRRLNQAKSKFTDFDGPATGETITEWLQRMKDYCIQDTLVTMQLDKHLVHELDKFMFSEQCRTLEHKVQAIVAQQVRNGWPLNMQEAISLLTQLKTEQAQIEEGMQKVFEPTIVQLKTKQKVIQFNPGSRQQVADRLIKRGWKPTEKTLTGQYVVNEKTLEKCPVPEAKLIIRYMMLGKRTSQIEQWIEAAEADGKVHGKVFTNGAVTGRMTHSGPNMAQVPAVGKEYGKECRALFVTPSKDWKLVGIDASGLELRMLAHYMQDYDYVVTVTTGRQDEGTDVHTVNQKAAGLPSRSAAKTFIYALLYGAGPAKIGSIVGGGYVEGQVLIDSFMRNLPSLGNLSKKVAKYASTGKIPGLDGRQIWIRSPHAALNSLLQGAGAMVMKQALVIFDDKLKKQKIPYQFLGNIHDEIQLTVPEQHAILAGELGIQAIKEAGLHFKLRCPLDGECKIGRNWSETH
jgi:DNA polymerase I-like protein with 3'-5' exonuclease and polymerase domains